MKKALFFTLLVSTNALPAQDYSAFTSTIRILEFSDSVTVESTWSHLKNSQKVPFIVHDSVAFLFHR